jgi:hypothetical protein
MVMGSLDEAGVASEANTEQVDPDDVITGLQGSKGL